MKPICLPFAENFRELPTKLTVIGFGMTEINSNGSAILLKADMPTVTKEVCESIFKNVNLKLTSNQFCVGGEQNKVE